MGLSLEMLSEEARYPVVACYPIFQHVCHKHVVGSSNHQLLSQSAVHSPPPHPEFRANPHKLKWAIQPSESVE